MSKPNFKVLTSQNACPPASGLLVTPINHPRSVAQLLSADMSQPPSSHTRSESREWPQSQTGDSSRSRDKKRVGFKNAQRNDDAGNAGEMHTPPHYRSESPMPRAGVLSGSNTPRERKRDSINDEELASALEQIIRPEHHSPELPRPKPALRKTRPPSLQISPESTVTPPEQIYRSEAAAKHRAERLAVHVESWSAAGSRRNSFDSPLTTPRPDEALLSHGSAGPATWTRNGEDSDLPGGAEGVRARKKVVTVPRPIAIGGITRQHDDEDSPFSDAHAYDPPLKSGQITPTAADLEYVPRPSKYKSGILSSMFKLYKGGLPNKEYDSRPSTPNTPNTPNRTPRPSPPPSTPGTPVLRPRNGLFGLRAHHSASSVTTLSGLIGSSSSLAGPGSSNIAEALSEKAKHGSHRSKPKSKQSQKNTRLEDEIRIRVHIAEVISRQRYLVKLCRALMMYGAPTHRLEGYMSMSARVLGIESQFLYLPGCMFISFDDSQTHTTEVQIVRAGQGVDFGRLTDTHRIYKEVRATQSI